MKEIKYVYIMNIEWKDFSLVSRLLQLAFEPISLLLLWLVKCICGLVVEKNMIHIQSNNSNRSVAGMHLKM